MIVLQAMKFKHERNLKKQNNKIEAREKNREKKSCKKNAKNENNSTAVTQNARFLYKDLYVGL